jgi:hypothetical protein
MARYTVDPVTGIRTKVSGTNYVPPCVAKTAARKAVAKQEPIITETVTDEATHESIDTDADPSR